MKLTLPQRPKRPQCQQLLDLLSRTHLSWINPHTHDTKYLLNQLCNRHHLESNVQVGSVCAHVARHYSAHRMRRQYADLFAAEKIVEKYQIIFKNKQAKSEGQRSITQGAGLNTMEKLIFYGKVCLVLTMKPQFKQSITNLKQFDQRLISIVRKLLSSLLLQFIPAEYSQLVLKLYLQDAQTEQEREWMQENKMKHEDVYPFHDFFQVLSSLSYHILNTRRAINWQHYLEILANPSVGCVEWPMVIGVRNLHRLPYPQS